MRVHLYHYRGKTREVPGSFLEGECKRGLAEPWWLEFPDETLGEVLRAMSLTYDVMLLGPRQDVYFSIHLDDKGKRFRQM